MQENRDKKTLNMDNFQADVSHCLQLNDGIRTLYQQGFWSFLITVCTKMMLF